jgi:hypothetical protein
MRVVRDVTTVAAVFLVRGCCRTHKKASHVHLYYEGGGACDLKSRVAEHRGCLINNCNHDITQLGKDLQTLMILFVAKSLLAASTIPNLRRELTCN